MLKLMLFFLCAIMVFSFCNQATSTPSVIQKPLDTTPQKKEITDTIDLVFVGDIMMGTNYPAPGYLPPNNGKDLFKEVAPYLQNADITFGNCEGTLFDAGGTPKQCANPAVCYAFRQPAALGNNLKEAGFNLISIANNHFGDFGEEGRKQTIANLEKLGMKIAGQESHPTTIIQAKGIKLGMVAVAPNNNCIKINDYERVKKYIAELKKECHLVLVSFHGGAEGRDHTHVPRKHEIFYGEDRGNVYEFAHTMVDAGADMVIGHGPHVTRAFDYYKGKFIAYSLGNFCTWDRVSLAGVSGIAPILKLSVTAKGVLTKASIIPTRQVGKGIPIIDSFKQVTRQLQALTSKDFPEAQLNINEKGYIIFKN
jgi:poly-gamma-glutamate capsule biosynthesis protein CapA/YwtB (metallophosphatase superfamily)